jgi:hypothetical protein
LRSLALFGLGPAAAAVLLTVCDARTGGGAPVQASRQARDASAFVDSLGVNVHISWPGVAPYSDTARVVAAMRRLGLRNMRDQMNGATLPLYQSLAAQGFRFDLLYDRADPLADYMAQVRALEASHPGAVLSLEGPNEVNDWAAAAAGVQGALHRAAKADPLLAAKPVYAATIAGLDRAAYAKLAIAGAADDGNVHIYYGGGMPSYGASPGDLTWSWSNYLASGNWNAPDRPVVVTETGAPTMPSSNDGVDDYTQARQILDSVMDAAKAGTPMTYLYELVDLQPYWPSDNVQAHFGLFNADWTPKLAATGLHNLTTILTDGGPLSGPPGSLDYTIQGTPQWGGQLLFQEGDGTMDIVVWAEPDIWDTQGHSRLAAAETPVAVALASPARVAIYDPLQSATPIRVLGTTRQIALTVADHPLIVEVKPAGR